MRPTRALTAANLAVLAAGVLVLGTAGVPDRVAASVVPAASPSPAASAVPSPSVAAPTPAPRVAVPPPPPSPTVAPVAPPQRVTTRTGWRPYATVGDVVLHLPGEVVEVVGLHQSGHDGAQPQSPLPGGPRTGLLESRERGTHPQGAADVVVDPTRPVRAPVTGTVVRAGSYTLYCDHVDQVLVVSPDAQPELEVKLLHFQGLSVAVGDRVTGGVTVVGSGARVLPFASQVDEHTIAPHWPHVHVEVVDPRIEDTPSGGSC